MRLRTWILACAISAVGVEAHAEAGFLSGTMFETVGNELSLDPLLLYCVALAESAILQGKASVGPYPWVLRTDEGPLFFNSKEEAEAGLTKVLERTRHVDIGLMQYNLFYHPHNTPLELLDPLTNLRAAGAYLKTTLASTTDPVQGVGRYHNYDPSRAQWYGSKVWKLYSNIQALALK